MLPGHVASYALVHWFGGDEQGKGHPGLLQPGICLAVDRHKGIVDGDTDGPFRQRVFRPQARDDFRQRQNRVFRLGEFGQVGFELIDADIRRWMRIFTKAVIHHDDG